jgi:hypothetical protein
MSRVLVRLSVLVAVVLCATRAQAAPIVIDFESLDEFSDVGNMIPGLSFSNATVLTAGTSLNEFDFPPLSGSNVVFDTGGPMRVDILGGAYAVGGFFTYVAPLTLTAYDAANNFLGIVTSLALENYGSSGGSPNEWLQFASTTAISYVLFSGLSDGGSFTLDDFSYDPQAPISPNPVPEPTSLVLLGSGIAAVLGKQLRDRRCQQQHGGVPVRIR